MLLTKPGCHLCDDARAVLERVLAPRGLSYEERNILEDAALTVEYAEEIPVVLLNGLVHQIWRIVPERLEAALAAAERSGDPDAPRH